VDNKLFQVTTLDRTVDHQLGSALRHVFHGAVTSPSAIDAHDLRMMTLLKYDPPIYTLIAHRRFLPDKEPTDMLQCRDN
jgi:hypothetical protein